jgi:hypothetical protein
MTMPATVKAQVRIEKMVARILAETSEKESYQIEAWRKPADDIKRLVRHDYVRSVRRNLPYRDLKTLKSAFEFLPDFNRKVIGMMPTEQLAGIATDFKLHFNASPNVGEEGMALRGFYITRNESILKQPLIYVNTAHQPIAISATFCHELAHHMSTELLGKDENTPVHFFFDADYASHLDEPNELAADAMVSIAGYPEPVARRIFATEWKWGLVAKAKDMTEAALAEVRGHLKRAYGFDVMELVAANQRLHYLSGMIHYAKLRWALLAEYDI